MSDTVLQRLVWKEYRVQRGFWLSMAGLAVVCQVVVLLIPERSVSHASVLFGLAFGFPAFYALGCGATLFAAEREEGTLELLRVLAAPGWKVWWSKLGFSVASTVGLLGLLWVLAFSLSRGKSFDAELQVSLWAVWGVLAIEFLGWAIFFSLVTKRPINAACMAAVASVGSLSVVSGVGSARWLMAPGHYDTMPIIICWILQVLGLFGVDAWIAMRWVLDRPAKRRDVRLKTEQQIALRQLRQRAVVASVAAVAAIMFLPALVTFLSLPRRIDLGSLIVLSVVALAEAIAWGVFFSLLTRRTALATVLASVIGFVSCHVLTFIFAVSFYSGPGMQDLEIWQDAVPLRMGYALLILGVDVSLALRWRVTLGSEVSVRTNPESVRPVPPLRGLLWQERRQAWKTMAVFWSVAVALLLFYRVFDPLRDDVSFSFAIVVAGILSSLMGSCAFLAEQEGQHFHFFADHGIGARKVWLAKQLVWLPAALATAGVFCSLSFLSLRYEPRDFITSALLGTALLPPIGYCCGQFASILLPRGLVAGLMGLVLSFLVLLWQLLMQHLGVSLWWSVLPIPLVLLVATWLRAPDWLLERRGWRAWLRLIALLLVPLIGLPAAVSAYRVFEIPATGPGFSPHEVLRPVTRDEMETATMYRQAIAALKPMRHDDSLQKKEEEITFALQGWEHVTPVERAWLEANRSALEITLAASHRPSCVFYEPKDHRIDSRLDEAQATRELAWLLLLEARRLESQGELDEALECYLATVRLGHHVAARGTAIQYMIGNGIDALVCERMPHWAAHADQTPDRIRNALRRIEELFRSTPPLADAIKLEYLSIRRAMETDFDGLAADTGQDADVAGAVLTRHLMPSEYARAFRLLDYRTTETLHFVAEVNASLSSGLPPTPWRPTAQAGYDENTRVDRWARTTVVPLDPRADYWGTLPLHQETRHRSLRLILALKGWQAEHGDLPETLDALVDDYFDRLPLDPRSGKPFEYIPRGYDVPVRFDWLAEFLSKRGQALLISRGPTSIQLEQDRRASNGQPQYRAITLPGGVSYPVWAFPIP